MDATSSYIQAMGRIDCEFQAIDGPLEHPSVTLLEQEGDGKLAGLRQQHNELGDVLLLVLFC